MKLAVWVWLAGLMFGWLAGLVASFYFECTSVKNASRIWCSALLCAKVLPAALPTISFVPSMQMLIIHLNIITLVSHTLTTGVLDDWLLVFRMRYVNL